MVKKLYDNVFFQIAIVWLVGFLLISLQFSVVHAASASEPNKIYFFYGSGCPHCETVINYFEKENIFNTYPIEKREIYSNRENALLFNKMLDNLGIDEQKRGVPTMIIGKKVLVGDKVILDSFIAEADQFQRTRVEPESIQPLSDDVTHKSSSPNLTLAAVVIGSIVDAINPCEFAVLIILMSTVLATGDPRKALRTGLAFAASIFISYFLMGLGLYKALSIGGFSSIFFTVVGWVAIVLGLLNLKDYFWYGKGVLMEVPLSWRPQLKKIIQSVTNPLGAFCVGFVVSLFLLPCTSGPYTVVLGMLAEKTYDIQAVLYLLLYNLIFVSPMVLISWIVYKGFDPKKAEEIRQKRLRTLHLIAGIVMLAMGIFIVLGWV